MRDLVLSATMTWYRGQLSFETENLHFVVYGRSFEDILNLAENYIEVYLENFLAKDMILTSKSIIPNELNFLIIELPSNIFLKGPEINQLEEYLVAIFKTLSVKKELGI